MQTAENRIFPPLEVVSRLGNDETLGVFKTRLDSGLHLALKLVLNLLKLLAEFDDLVSILLKLVLECFRLLGGFLEIGGWFHLQRKTLTVKIRVAEA